MSRRWVALVLVTVFCGCARRTVEKSNPLPTGDAIWFEQTLAPSETEVEDALLRAGLTSVFLPAARLARREGHWEADEMPTPPRAFAKSNVFLVIGADRSVESMMARPETVGPLGDAVWLAVKSALKDTRAYGRVVGIHLDLPLTDQTAGSYGALISALRAKMPRGMTLTVSLRYAPGLQEREKFRDSLSGADGFVAFVFGEGDTVDPVAVDALEKQWWAGYAPSARGTWTAADGKERPELAEWVLERLSNEPKVELLESVSLKEESDQGFDLVPRSRVSLGPDLTFAEGDRLRFRQPLESELIYRMGSDLAGKRFARGRVIALPGHSENERLLPVAALTDILFGKPAKPDFHIAADPGRGEISVSAENLSTHASVVSRTANWVEVAVPSGKIRDVRLGGFDRFEVYGPDHEPITMGLATSVRFYETLIQPYEKIEAAHILLRGAAPRDCCRTQFHVLAASGREIGSESAAK